MPGQRLFELKKLVAELSLDFFILKEVSGETSEPVEETQGSETRL